MLNYGANLFDGEADGDDVKEFSGFGCVAWLVMAMARDLPP